MTERMTSVEIEDVLSSIRRLVTQDLRPKPPAGDDKLLLTPALRVVPPADVAEPTVDAGDDAPFMDIGAAEPVFVRHAVRQDLAGAVTSIGAEVSADGYEPETGEIGPADAMPVPEWPDSSWVAPDIISEVDEAEVVALPEEPHGWAQTDHAAEPDLPEDSAAAHLFDGDDDDLVADPHTIDPAGDDAEAAARAALDEDENAGDDAGLTALDESMLRDIVRDILREELHGALGERITRNVRKLVRAEINRAMTARDLE
jgi:cell pole-organizing protein PopZ